MSRGLGYVIGYLSTLVVGWFIPLIGLALIIPFIQIAYFLQPLLALGLMFILGAILVVYSLQREATAQAIIWAILWGGGIIGVVTELFYYYCLFIVGILMVILFIPGMVSSAWNRALRWFATGEVAITLGLMWAQYTRISAIVLLTAGLLLIFALLLGSGSYRPFEIRKIRRRLATICIIVSICFIFWKPLILPAADLMFNTVNMSPLGRWYNIAFLKIERRYITEKAKTDALRQIENEIISSYRQRWEEAIKTIPQIPVSAQEWEDLGVSSYQKEP